MSKDHLGTSVNANPGPQGSNADRVDLGQDTGISIFHKRSLYVIQMQVGAHGESQVLTPVQAPECPQLDPGRGIRNVNPSLTDITS